MPTATKPKLPPAPPPATTAAAAGFVPKAEPPKIRKGGTVRPSAICINAVEGFGKTTIGACAPDPIFLMARGETGLDTLAGRGLVPDVSRFDEIQTWPEVLAAISYLATEETGHKTVVLDALSGFERLCHEHVCDRDFEGNWGQNGFISWNRGCRAAITDFLQLLQGLDRLRNKGMSIIALSHCLVRPYKNPIGEDFDRFVADCSKETWGAVHKWCDAVFFGNFFTIVDEDRQHRKRGIGGTERILYTTHSDAFDAKNRFGLAEPIDIPNDPAKSWETIATAIKGDK